MSLAGEPSQPTQSSSAIPPSLPLADHRRLRSTRLAGAGALPERGVPSDAGLIFRDTAEMSAKFYCVDIQANGERFGSLRFGISSGLRRLLDM